MGGPEELQVTTILHTSLMVTQVHAILSLQEIDFYHLILSPLEKGLRGRSGTREKVGLLSSPAQN